MKFVIYERIDTTHAKRVAVYGTRNLAQELVKEMEMIDIEQDIYEPMRYFIEEVSDDGARTMQDL